MAFDMLSGVPTSAQGSLGASAPPPPPPKPLDDSDARMKSFDAKQEALSNKLDTVRTDTVAKNQKLEDFFADNKPPVYRPPAPYKPSQDENPISMWGALAIGFAALASHFTRTPMTTALNAAGAALTAMKQSNMEAAKASYEQWKDANAQALELAKYQQEAYKNLMSTIERRESNNIALSKDQTADVRAQMTALASAFKDDTMLKLGEAHDLNAQKLEFDRRQHEIDQLGVQTEKLQQGWEKAQTAIQTAKDEAEVKKTPEFKAAIAKGDTLGAMQQLAEANPDKYAAKLAELQQKKKDEDDKQQKYEESAAGQAAQQFRDWKASPEGQAASLDDQRKKENEIYGSFKSGGSRLYPPITPENKSFLANEFASYQMKPPTDAQLGRQPDMLAALEEAKKANPDYDPARYEIVQAARKKLTSGKDSDAIASYVRLDQHLDFFKGLVDKLSDGTDIKTLNRLAAAWGVQTGNPNVTSYETALQLVGDEMVKAATGTGAAGALGDREEIKKNFDPSLDKKQLQANINAVQVLVGGAMVSTLNKYKNLVSPKELTDAVGSREVMEHFHVNPDTLQPIVEGAYNFGGKSYDVNASGVTSKEAPGQQQAAGGATPKYSPEQMSGKAPIGAAADGKPVFLRDGKYVHEDGTPVQ
jgi:hypothetical protein